MATILRLDTYDFVKGLKASGMPEEQAKAIVDALKKASFENLVTKSDLVAVERSLQATVDRLKLDLLRWGIPVLVGQALLTPVLVKVLKV